MATYRKRDSGSWQAIVRRKGHPEASKTFSLKADAEIWATELEREIRLGALASRLKAERTTFKEVAERYAQKVLPTKRGGDRDQYRLKLLIKVFGAYSLSAITPGLIAKFIEGREHEGLAPQTIVHELNLLSRIFRKSINDWGIHLPDGIPTAKVTKPSIRNERSRRLVHDEEARILASIDNPGKSREGNPWIRPIVQLAIETAARQSELLSLNWKDVHLDVPAIRVRGVHGRITKNEDPYREIPLSPAAIDILKGMKNGRGNPNTVRIPRGPVFPTTASAVKQSWERAIQRARRTYECEVLAEGLTLAGLTEHETAAEIRKAKPMGGRRSEKPLRKETQEILNHLQDDPLLIDLHFHDLRHEGTSRLAQKLQLHELMKVTGHKSSRMLARYYHPRMEDLARKLA